MAKKRKKIPKSAWWAKVFLVHHPVRVWRQDVYHYRDGLHRRCEDGWLEREVHELLVSNLGPAAVSSHFRRDVVEAVRTEAYLPGNIEPPFLLPSLTPLPAIVTKNVVVGLESLFEGHEPTFFAPTDRIFAINGVSYSFDPAARCPKWIDFLRTTLGSDEIVRLVQQFAAWTWIGPARLNLQKVLWLCGLPGSGKSTILKVLRELFGADSTAGLGIDALRAKGGRFGLAPLMNKLANFAMDTPVRRYSNVSGLNSIIAADPVVLDRKFRDALTVVPSTTLYFGSNVAPTLGDSGADGWWRRLLLLYTRPRVGEEREELLDELRSELAGILSWSLEPIPALMACRKLTIPEEVKANVEQLQEEATAARQFLLEKVELGDGNDFIGRDELMGNFEQFCSRNNLQEQDIHEVKQEIKLLFNRDFQRLRRGGYSTKEKGRKRVPGWEGLKWKPDAVADDLAYISLRGAKAQSDLNKSIAQNEEERIRSWQLERENARLKALLNDLRRKERLPTTADAPNVESEVMAQQEYVAARKKALRSKEGIRAGLRLPLAATFPPEPNHDNGGSPSGDVDPEEIARLVEKLSEVEPSGADAPGGAQ